MSTQRLPKLADLDDVDAPDLWNTIVDLASMSDVDGPNLLGLGDLGDEIPPIEFDPWTDNDGGHGMTPTKWMAAALAAAAIALLIGYIVARDDSNSDVATTPEDVAETTTTTTTTRPPESTAVIGGGAALTFAEDYFVGLVAGDIEAMRATFTESPIINGTTDFEGFMFSRIHARAAGNRYLPRVCDVETEPTAVEGLAVPGPDQTAVVCEGITEPYAFQALGLPGVTLTATALVERDGISRLYFSSSEEAIATQNDVFGEFERWTQANEPDGRLTLRAETTSAEQAQEQGELEARLIDSWVAFLEENGCVYNEPCPAGS